MARRYKIRLLSYILAAQYFSESPLNGLVVNCQMAKNFATNRQLEVVCVLKRETFYPFKVIVSNSYQYYS